MPVSAERRAIHFSWHLLAITITIIHLHLIMTIITPPIQTSLLDLGPCRVPSLWLKVTQITVNLISHLPQSTINQLLCSHLSQAPESARLLRTHWVHHLLNNIGLEKRMPLQTILWVQDHLQALPFLVLALQAGLSIAIMSSILLCIKHHMLNMRLKAQHLRPPTNVWHPMPGGLFSPMTQMKNHPSHHPFQIVVEAELSTRQAMLAVFCVHG